MSWTERLLQARQEWPPDVQIQLEAEPEPPLFASTATVPTKVAASAAASSSMSSAYLIVPVVLVETRIVADKMKY